MRERFAAVLGAERVVSDPAALDAYNDDFSEHTPVTPALALLPESVEQVQALVRVAGELRVPLTPRVAGTNVGGLAIPPEGGVVVDLRRMNRVVAVHVDDMVAVIEPGVTQQQLKDHLEANKMPLTFGFSLGPVEQL